MRELPDDCLEIENSLPLWVGGDLEPEIQRAVDAHLARCARCADRGAKAQRARAALCLGLKLRVEGRTDPAIGSDPWPALRARLRAEGVLAGAARPPLRELERRKSARLRRIAFLGSIAAGLLLGLLFPWNRVAEPMPEIRPPVLTELEATDAVPPSRPVVPDAGQRAVASGVMVKPAGLRRLGAGEPRLRDSARIFGVQDGNSMGSPVGLEGRFEVPPR